MIQSVIEKSIGEIFGYDIAEKAKQDAVCSLNTRPLYTVGKTSIRILKKFVIPSSIAAVVLKSETGKEHPESSPCRPSELPLYEDDICACRPKRKSRAPIAAIEQETTGALEEQVRVIRKELWVWHDRYRGYRDTLVEKIEIAKAHSELKETSSKKDFFPQDEEFKPKLKTKRKIKSREDTKND